MDDCIFCKIVRKESPASILYEDEEVMSFLDINPIQNGHTLVIPKKHFVSILDVDTDATARVAIVIKRIAEKMSTVLHVEGINTFSAIGVAAGQEVFHYHIHVIPLGKGEKTKFAEWWEQVSKPRSADRVELEELSLRLRI